MLLLVPVVHERENRLGLMDREHRPVRNDDELLVGHDGCDFDDGIGLGLQTRHFQVDPDKIVAARHEMCATAIHELRSSLPEATLTLVIDTFDALVIATL